MSTRAWRIIGAAGVGVLAALALGSAAGRLFAARAAWPAGLAITLATAVMGLALVACLPWWRSIDDAARDAHKTAWWWGGCLGLGAGVISVIVLGGGPHSPMARGALLVFAAQALAYGVAWSVWWLARRSPLVP